MIPAKEKAKELTEKFMVRIIFNHKAPIQESSIPSAKQCALFCVDEMIKYGDKRGLNWLREVKQAIEKL